MSGTPLPSDVEAFRAGYRATELGPRYSGWAHLAFSSVGALLAIAWAVASLHQVAAAEWVMIPVGFVTANLGEYLGHRGPMHHARPGLRLLFERHTRQHHRFFTHQAMEYQTARDFKMVLFPPVMLVFFVGGLATPIGLLFCLLWSRNAGLLFAATAISYFLTYEWLHFSYHFQVDSWVGRLPLMDVLRRHHTLHHDMQRMSRYNFNITFPICDWIFGTLYRPGVSADLAAPPEA